MPPLGDLLTHSIYFALAVGSLGLAVTAARILQTTDDGRRVFWWAILLIASGSTIEHGWRTALRLGDRPGWMVDHPVLVFGGLIALLGFAIPPYAARDRINGRWIVIPSMILAALLLGLVSAIF